MHNPKVNYGKFKHYTSCRFCKTKNLVRVLSLGDVPLAGGFLKNEGEISNEKLYPLDLSFCKKCFLLQSVNVVNADTLFKDYFYHSSAIQTLVGHFKKVAREITTDLPSKKNSLIVEIGANDGSLIEELNNMKIKAIGVDPATNVVQPRIKEGIPIINAYFSRAIAKKIVKKYGRADVITSFNTLAHIEDMHEIVNGIKILLKDDGYLMFETHYLGKIFEENQYDMIYHEHQYYYSLITLQNFFEQFDMEIFNVKPVDIHHGSMRYYVQNKSLGKNKIKSSVKKLEKEEYKLGLDKAATYKLLAKNINSTKRELLFLLNRLKKENKQVVGYGASGRGTIIMNYCGLTNKYLDYVIDDAPAKQGALTPGNHLKIVDSSSLLIDRPNYVVLFAWAFLKEIKKKNIEYLSNNGKFILPLPHVKIISK